MFLFTLNLSTFNTLNINLSKFLKKYFTLEYEDTNSGYFYQS